ncbi:right-handed parallel beta-helix repeat-containing protein [Kitasatospora herbaricolor]|uniref:Right-handed parallel beta-helix repeat-containing protein n=1 Tax=Kitasatospora herbaricolor TaxID=68217 RepID=A0ABZ1WA78_9ACTN|nr:right-handed parallel beta-helix repeat-containing protein [Kitasatospora herbaricolor]
MHNRRLVATTAALAAGFAFLPGQAHAADPAPNAVPNAVPAPAASGWELPDAKTFTSPASNSYRVQGQGAAVAARAAAAPSTGRTVYVLTRSTCATDTGTGTQAAPFCSLQHGVDAAVPGDTVRVDGKDEGTSPPRTAENVVVRTSGLTITGGTNAPQIDGDNTGSTKPGLTLDGVSDVTISHLTVSTGGVPAALAVKGSSRITLDSVNVGAYGTAVAVDGASDTVAVTRSHVALFSAGATAISVAAGAKGVTLAGNLIGASGITNSGTYEQQISGITATGVQGLNITGNTVQRGCLPGIVVDGASTAVSIQNNLLVETENAAACDSGQSAVTVSAESAPATTADYNDFYSAVATGAGPYRWAGTAYPTVAAFRAAQPQGAHDTVEPVAPQPVNNGSDWGVAYALQAGSAAIGTANQSAPRALTTDYFGHGPMSDRGAVRFQSNNPGFAMALTAKNSSAFGISLDLDVTTLPVAQDIYIEWGDGSTGISNFYGDKPVKATAGHIYEKLGDYTITVTDYEKTGNTIRNTVKVSTLGSQYTAYGPKRLLDSRDGTGLAAAGRIPAYGTVKLKVGGADGIPANATAAVLNLTVTGPAADGHITAYPDGGQRPTTSNVNYRAKQTVPNLVMVPIGDNGYVDLYNGGWDTTDLIADITGYFTPTAAAGFVPVGPSRLVDTREGTGAPRGQVPGRSSIPVQIAGATPGLPNGGITAVALNVTVTNPRQDGHLIVYPSGQALPTASNVNFTAGQTVANSVVVPVGADGRIQVFNGAWAGTDVIVDVVGYYSAYEKGAFIPVDPERLIDTRDPATWGGGPLKGRYYAYLPMTTRTDIPAFVFNATVTNTGDDGHLTVASDPNTLADYRGGYPYPVYAPNTSSLNWRRGSTVPNLVQVAPGRGLIDFFNESDGNIDLIVDIFGYYQND